MSARFVELRTLFAQANEEKSATRLLHLPFLLSAFRLWRKPYLDGSRVRFQMTARGLVI